MPYSRNGKAWRLLTSRPVDCRCFNKGRSILYPALITLFIAAIITVVGLHAIRAFKSANPDL